jgi:hypothetical protein
MTDRDILLLIESCIRSIREDRISLAEEKLGVLTDKLRERIETDLKSKSGMF